MSDQSRTFRLDEFLDSVEGETIYVTAPDGLGYRPGNLVADETDTVYCSDCDEFHMPVGVPIGHCPRCGQKPGALELGTRKEDLEL